MPTINDSPDLSLDITGTDLVEVEVRADGTVLWVNTPFGCKLRICRIGKLVITDHRQSFDPSSLSDGDLIACLEEMRKRDREAMSPIDAE